jgi:hypothetical protein
MSIPTCPKCGKTFTKDSSVTRHLSQPRTSCHSYTHDVVDISQFAEVEPPRHQVSELDNSHRFLQPHDEDHLQYHDDDVFGTVDNDFGTSGESLEEKYEGAGTCYSQDGLTFLDLFDADEYAECRKYNLFYPFASKEEWEVADFLLRSPLSMAATDEFLKLPMVCALRALRHRL